MRELTTFLTFIGGVIVGLFIAFQMIPGAELSDLFGGTLNFDPLGLGSTFGAMQSAFRGIMIAFLWGAFGLTIALVAKVLFGGFGAVFKSINGKPSDKSRASAE